ncbi:MAG: glycosyltransferase family 2 protein [Cyclobacteriaceae bacterium]|nr:glycosyltransferase family 2 protein [Cyclobacteriaceae bacterium]
MKKPLVSLITVNFNTTKDTVEFLESVKELTYNNIEVIVIDNGSRNSPKDELEAVYPTLTYIQSPSNLGFAGGNNLGISIAKGDYLFFLNSDTILFPDSLDSLIDYLEANPSVGMASPKVLYPDIRIVQYAGGVAINPYTGRGKQLGFLETDKGQFDTCYETGWGHGAALIVPRRVIEKIGPMPELYFLYYEEIDWGESAKRNGFQVHFVGTSRIIHKEAISMGGNESETKAYYMTRSRLLYMRRNSSGLPKFTGLLFFFMITVPKQTFEYLIRGKFRLLRSFYKGIGGYLVN